MTIRNPNLQEFFQYEHFSIFKNQFLMVLKTTSYITEHYLLMQRPTTDGANRLISTATTMRKQHTRKKN